MPDAAGIIHGSCVAFGAGGVLILGAPGSGKSALALEMMARGAALVADDRVRLHDGGDGVVASAPARIAGLIEARGVGILAAEARASAVIRLAVDLDTTETDRLPPRRRINVIGYDIDLVHNPAHGYFPAAIRQYLLGGRYA